MRILINDPISTVIIPENIKRYVLKANFFLKVSYSQNEILMSSNLSKSQPNLKTDFCPGFIGQKSVKNLVGFLGDLKTPTVHSEINWPLETNILLIKQSEH